MKVRKLIALGLIALIVIGSLGGCGSSSDTPSASNSDADASASTAESTQSASEANTSTGGELSVYTSYSEEESQFMFDAFEEATGIKVKSVRLSAGEIYARVQAEGNNPQASVWYGTSTETLALAGQEGYLEPYKSPALAEVPEQWQDPEGMWSPSSLSILCFINNTDWLEDNGLEAPTSWNDVLDEAYKNNIVLAHPATSGMSYSWLSTVVQHMGEDEGFTYIKNLSQNIFQYAKSGGAPARMVGLGEAAVAFCWGAEAMLVKDSGYPVTISYPSEGTGYELTGEAIIKGGPADELENAKAFIDWTLSKEAQELYVNTYYRLPVNETASVPDGMTNTTDVDLVDLDSTWSTENRDRLINKFETEIRDQENLS